MTLGYWQPSMTYPKRKNWEHCLINLNHSQMMSIIQELVCPISKLALTSTLYTADIFKQILMYETVNPLITSLLNHNPLFVWILCLLPRPPAHTLQVGTMKVGICKAKALKFWFQQNNLCNFPLEPFYLKKINCYEDVNILQSKF